MAELDKALDQLKQMLSTEDGQKNLESLIESVAAPASAPAEPKKKSSAVNLDAMLKIKKLMDGMDMDNDPRVRVLHALRPYLSGSRGEYIENAIKVMSITKIPELLKEARK